MNEQTLIELFGGNAQIQALPGAGSNRKYFRLNDNSRSAIGVIGTSLAENEAFVTMSQHFRNKGLPMPEIYSVGSDRMAYLQEDLGDTALYDLIAKNDPSYPLYLEKAVRWLPRIQFEGAEGLDFSVCYPISDFNHRAISWDLNYFKYCFLKATGIEFDESRLEDDFERLGSDLLSLDSHTFMYRDFQSRNIMIKDNDVHFIDFQGGRRGPFYYDIVSLLWQAKANLPQSQRIEMLDIYHAELQKFYKIDRESFLSNIKEFVLFRTLQVLGAYGFRGFFERKSHFMQSVPFAVDNLRQLLADSDFSRYPYLVDILSQLTKMPRFSQPEKKTELTVAVRSFSYKKGYPEDISGNGGGFVFDCRALHNPGRYDQYKPFTGMDQCVIDFIEQDGGMQKFLENVYAIVDASVKKYIERGFTSLMVCFGCTGGRHRSVYGAQHLAEHIYEKFNVRVDLEHIEQKVKRTYTPKK